MSNLIHTHQACPLCQHNGCLSIWALDTGGFSFKCLSCDESGIVEDLDQFFGGEFIPMTERQEAALKVVQRHSDPYVPDEYRNITKHTMERLGVYFTKNLDTGEETVHYHYPNAVKHRTLPKTIKVSGPIHHFWGHDDCKGGKLVLITEGEEDRMSAHQMLGDVDSLSLPNASPSKQFWDNAKDKLANYQKIVVSADADEAGDKVAKKIYQLFPGKVYIMDHGKYKDANDFLKAGDVKGYRNSFWNATPLKPENIKSTYEDFLSLFHETPDYEYFETGIPELDEKMLGIHKGAFTVILAETGVGKTEFFRYLEHKVLEGEKYKLAICHGEETQLRSILGLYSYSRKMNLIRKDTVEKLGLVDDYAKWLEELTKREQLYQFSIRVDEGVDEIVSQVRFLATAMDVDYIFLEPIQDFVSAANTTEKESLLTDLTVKLKRLAPELNVGIVVIAHANKEGEAKYAASIVQGAAYELRLVRDPDGDEPDITKVYIGRKNRTGGGSGPAGKMSFDFESFTMSPIVNAPTTGTANMKDIGND